MDDLDDILNAAERHLKKLKTRRNSESNLPKGNGATVQSRRNSAVPTTKTTLASTNSCISKQNDATSKPNLPNPLETKGDANSVIATGPPVAAGIPIVLDNGSFSIKAGISGESKPRIVIYLDNKQGKEVYISHWRSIFQTFGIDPSLHPILTTELPETSKTSKDQVFEVLFQQLGVPCVCAASEGVLSMYGTGTVTGLLVNIGHSQCQAVPVIQGCPLESAAFTLHNKIAGASIDDFLERLLTERGYFVSVAGKKAILRLSDIRIIKEKYCYVAHDFEDEMTRFGEANNAIYITPDGEKIVIGNQRFRCAELLFNPNLVGLDLPGLPEILYNCIQKAPIDSRKELLGNILLCGGSCLFPGLAERLTLEMCKLIPKGMRNSDVRVVVADECQFLSWKGGSVLANLEDFQDNHCSWKHEFVHVVGKEKL